MSNTQTKQTNNFNYNLTLDELLKTSAELATDQENFENSIDTDISIMDARTRNDNSTRDSQYRSKIALIFTWSFIIIMAIIVIGVPIYNATIGSNTQIDQGMLMEGFNSIFGPILGFVLGYYFKGRSGKEK